MTQRLFHQGTGVKSDRSIPTLNWRKPGKFFVITLFWSKQSSVYTIMYNVKLGFFQRADSTDQIWLTGARPFVVSVT